MAEVHEKFNVLIKENNTQGFGNRPIRPTAAGTIFVENGFLIIFISLLYYFNSLTKNIYADKIILSLYLFLNIIIWTIFSSLLDIIFSIYFSTIFQKISFYKNEKY